MNSPSKLNSNFTEQGCWSQWNWAKPTAWKCPSLYIVGSASTLTGPSTLQSAQHASSLLKAYLTSIHNHLCLIPSPKPTPEASALVLASHQGLQSDRAATHIVFTSAIVIATKLHCYKVTLPKLQRTALHCEHLCSMPLPKPTSEAPPTLHPKIGLRTLLCAPALRRTL